MTSGTNTRVIGIIGPPCSGKSTVAEFVQSLGGVWLNADKIAKEQLGNPDVIGQLVESFGNGILAVDGTLSRERIADLVFGEDAASQARLKKLESIIHPRTRAIIREALCEAKDRDTAYVILDVPLLLESGWQDECDEVWCLQVSPERHEALLAARGWDAAELQRREKRQLSWQEKRRRSDWVIANDGSVEDLQMKVRERLNR
ncbi:dephospho-CoA kinase [Rhodopirellula sp. ICT_H3.1]|uniref:Dephospho-CoA kinase n=2 Tax=Aporhodopirellula aestuarii TaxID=2950107 RepID=A0ABT0U940_9BACT|nr:dephospho-CoA kinase [Aporhodopirellula aestuarii]